jgi:biopolymer transport protein TolQ
MRQCLRWSILMMSLLLAAGSFPSISAPAQTQSAGGAGAPAAPSPVAGATPGGDVASLEPAAEVDLGGQGIFTRALQGGWIVFVCLLVLLTMSVLTWAVVIAKYFYLMRIQKTGDGFIKSFWDSRSLNDLNGRLADYPYSPVREVFRSGYAELVRGSQLRDQASTTELAVSAALDNLGRALGKAKLFERRRVEKFMSVLAISASACPFIGLFGTVWGIMGSFEGIARTGSASLAAVAPGISEALISTAFGLAAAIPAVVGYNVFAARVRHVMASLDGFSADFLNIVERYLVTDKPKASASAGAPLGDRL